MGYTSAQATDFINRIGPLMVSEGKKRGYAIISTAIAQAIIEGACGTSSLAKKYHNHFGLKCGSSWKGASVNMKTKEEYKVGTLTTIKDNFRAYASDQEGVKGYYDFISTKRYSNLKTALTYKQYAEMLKADGYATSSSYINTLCKTVEKYNLTRFDNQTVTETVNASMNKSVDQLAREVINGYWMSGTTRKLLLEAAGYDYDAVQKRVNEILKGNK